MCWYFGDFVCVFFFNKLGFFYVNLNCDIDYLLYLLF
jgi:hypothetical protein